MMGIHVSSRFTPDHGASIQPASHHLCRNPGDFSKAAKYAQEHLANAVGGKGGAYGCETPNARSNASNVRYFSIGGAAHDGAAIFQ